MMTLHKLAAGSGYTYLTRQVARQAQPPRSGARLGVRDGASQRALRITCRRGIWARPYGNAAPLPP